MENNYPRFWAVLREYGNATAIIDGRSGKEWTYAQLASEVERIAERLASPQKNLIFVRLDNTTEDVLFYLAVLHSRNVPYIYTSHTPPRSLVDLIARFSPDIVAGPAGSLAPKDSYEIRSVVSYQLSYRREHRHQKLFDPLALLLSTSGSTGSSKLVRLSEQNVQINASQISAALNILPQHRAITSLPLSYVYGLSILHSNLSAGSSVVIDDRSVMDREFWNSVKLWNVTTFAGVPWTYQMLRTLRITKPSFPCLAMFTTSGSKVDRATNQWFAEELRGCDVYYMYGQTEASGRIAVLPAELAKSKTGSVGMSVREGELECLSDGTIVYRGPNVMLGYATSAEELTLGDQLFGELDTGDIGVLDSDGCLFITGRKNRLCKIYGVRINLDEVQEFFREADLEVLASEDTSGSLAINYSRASDDLVLKRACEIRSNFGIPRSAIVLRRVNDLDRLLSGKIALRGG